MSEIVYVETSKGVMQPRPSPHQRRKTREAERLKTEKRKNFWASVAGISIMLLAFAAWLAATWIGFGDGWRYL